MWPIYCNLLYLVDCRICRGRRRRSAQAGGSALAAALRNVTSQTSILDFLDLACQTTTALLGNDTAAANQEESEECLGIPCYARVNIRCYVYMYIFQDLCIAVPEVDSAASFFL